MALLRISPDGKEVLHLYDDKLVEMTRKTSDIEIKRATDVFFDNEDQVWRIKFLPRGLKDMETILAIPFGTREEALEYERGALENDMRCHFV
jgi:hypothetical protein